MNGASTEQLLPAFGRVVLIRGTCAFTLQDILAYGWFLGELEAPCNELMNGIAREESASALGLESDDEVLNAMSEEFRYARDLLTIEETERWFLARDLTEDDFSNYLVRRYWQDNPPDTPATERIDFLTASAELRELFRVDLLLSGKFDDLTRAASWRLAAGAEPNKTEPDPDLKYEERARFFERTGLDEATLPAALNLLNRTATWLEECLQLEVCYRQESGLVLSDQARVRGLATLRLPLTRVKFQTLSLPSREAAQEAVLCLTADGLSPEQVANESGSCWEEQDLFVGDLSPDVQQEFLSAAPGEVLPLKEAENGFSVIRIMAKAEPALADDEVRDRIDQRLMESHFSELCSKHIRCVLGEPVHG
jgi:hypothetical protein